MNKLNKSNLLIMALLILFGITSRLLVHLPNFVPIAAIAWFATFYFSRAKAYLITLVVMLVSDAVIGFYTSAVMISVYGSFLLIAYLAKWLKKNNSLKNLTSASLLGSTLFYLITNTAVWLFTPLYTKNLAGLAQSFWLALPFFRNTLLGDLFYVGVLFGVYEIVRCHAARRVKVIREKV